MKAETLSAKTIRHCMHETKHIHAVKDNITTNLSIGEFRVVINKSFVRAPPSALSLTRISQITSSSNARRFNSTPALDTFPFWSP